MSKRNMQIEGLRGIAMLFVIAFHYFSVFPSKFYEPLHHNWCGIEVWGYFGVGIFILISGYFMIGEKKEKPVSFTVKKVLRLWLPYMVAITLCFLVTRITPLPGRTVSVWAYLANIPFLNGFISIDYVDGAHWYLTTLIACTFIAALISRINTKWQLGALFAWLLAILFFQKVSFENRIIDLLMDGTYKVLGGRYAAMFITGMILKKLQHEKILKNYIALIAANLVNLIVFGWIRECVFLIAQALFYLALKKRLPVLNFKMFTWLGMVSYSVYVLHQNIGFWGMYLFSEAVGGYSPVISVISVMLSIMAGTALYYAVEKPGNACVKKVITFIGG